MIVKFGTQQFRNCYTSTMAKLSKTKVETADSTPPEDSAQATPPIVDMEEAEHQAAVMEATAIAAQPPSPEPLLSAIEKQTEKEKAKYDPSPLVSAVLAEHRRTVGGTKKTYPPLYLETPRVRATPKTVESIIAMAGVTLVSPEELAKLQDLQAEMDATLATAEQFSTSQTSNHVYRMQMEQNARIRAGEDVSREVLPTRQQLFETNLSKSRALMEMMKDMTQQGTIPLCKPILDRLEKVIEDFAREQEEREREMAVAYDLEFHPSILLKAALDVLMSYQVRLRTTFDGWVLPRQALAGIVDL